VRLALHTSLSVGWERIFCRCRMQQWSGMSIGAWLFSPSRDLVGAWLFSYISHDKGWACECCVMRQSRGHHKAVATVVWEAGGSVVCTRVCCCIDQKGTRPQRKADAHSRTHSFPWSGMRERIREAATAKMRFPVCMQACTCIPASRHFSVLLGWDRCSIPEHGQHIILRACRRSRGERVLPLPPPRACNPA